ncbi:hypothetical protein OC834_001051 [Tilletia horrida]|nr:hypothetical protein OC834_001051 [Tilletia horrida]
MQLKIAFLIPALAAGAMAAAIGTVPRQESAVTTDILKRADYVSAAQDDGLVRCEN